MERLIGIATLLALIGPGSVDAGAKDGKIRWSHRKTGGTKTNDAIAVPAAKEKSPGSVTLKVTFEGGKLAEFALIGDGDTDLDVVVKDSSGNVVAKDVDPPAGEGGGSDICVCRWLPKETGEFTIVITNNGKFLNIAQAATN